MCDAQVQWDEEAAASAAARVKSRILDRCRGALEPGLLFRFVARLQARAIICNLKTA
jgi:hypothetical protein